MILNYKGIPVQDLIAFAIAIIGVISAILQRKWALPAPAKLWLKRLSLSEVICLLEWAQTMGDLSTAEKRQAVVAKLQELAVQTAGVRLPTSIANLLVEYAYARWQRK